MSNYGWQKPKVNKYADTKLIRKYKKLVSDTEKQKTAPILVMGRPVEELDEDDMDGMPDELQYQPEDKEREGDVDLRKMLVEALAQLNTTRDGRKHLRDKKAYPILKHYHLWEPDEEVQQACEEVVRIIVTPEMEEHVPGDGDLRKVELPKEGEEKPAGAAIVQVGAPEGYYLGNQHNT